MNLRLLPLAAAGAALLLAPLTLRADDPPAAKETQFFERFDTNSDGKVTKDEFAAGSGDSGAFALLDQNKDEVITPDELGLPADSKPKPRPEGGRGGEGAGPGAPGQPGGMGGDKRGEEFRKRMKEMDANGDGRISRDEWKGEAEMFDRMDRNKDGFLDKEDGPRQGQGGMGGMKVDPEAIKARWKKMDRDGDGKVSKDEYTGDFDFDRLDTDKDGFLTDADAKALPGMMGGMGGPGAPKGPGRMPTPEEITKRFAELDKDQNGKVEPAEMPEGLRDRMLKADANGDGALSPEEFGEGMKRNARAGDAGGPGALPSGKREGKGQPGEPGAGKPGLEAPGMEILRRFDHDHDGRVERDQFPGSDEKFAQLDKDGDGVLTEKDFPRPERQGPMPEKPKAPEGLIAKCDADGDGRLSRAEFHGSDDEWRHLDKNQDGWITADEAPPPPPAPAPAPAHEPK